METLRGVVEGVGVAAADGPQHEALHGGAETAAAHVHVCHLQCTAERLTKASVNTQAAHEGDAGVEVRVCHLQCTQQGDGTGTRCMLQVDEWGPKGVQQGTVICHRSYMDLEACQEAQGR